ncbi:MAG: hypothetical protein AAB851_02895, partial [Patescibacteria group bacterium]
MADFRIAFFQGGQTHGPARSLEKKKGIVFFEIFDVLRVGGGDGIAPFLNSPTLSLLPQSSTNIASNLLLISFACFIFLEYGR